jgi:hypothetical protein
MRGGRGSVTGLREHEKASRSHEERPNAFADRTSNPAALLSRSAADVQIEYFSLHIRGLSRPPTHVPIYRYASAGTDLRSGAVQRSTTPSKGTAYCVILHAWPDPSGIMPIKNVQGHTEPQLRS